MEVVRDDLLHQGETEGVHLDPTTSVPDSGVNHPTVGPGLHHSVLGVEADTGGPGPWDHDDCRPDPCYFCKTPRPPVLLRVPPALPSGGSDSQGEDPGDPKDQEVQVPHRVDMLRVRPGVSRGTATGTPLPRTVPLRQDHSPPGILWVLRGGVSPDVDQIPRF